MNDVVLILHRPCFSRFTPIISEPLAMVFSSSKKIKIDNQLHARLESQAQKRGYSSTDELIQHILEREINELEKEDGGSGSDQAEVERQLRGLGYLE